MRSRRPQRDLHFVGAESPRCMTRKRRADAAESQRDELQARALRAAAANGFGGDAFAEVRAQIGFESELPTVLNHPKESTMQAIAIEPSMHAGTTARYAKCIEVSKRVRWDIERDVILGRRFDFDKKFMPDGLSKIGRLTFLQPREQRFLSHVQGRTYANIFGLVERYIGAKTLELSRAHGLGDQIALEALVRMTDEELKHQALFRRLEEMAAEGMPAGYRFVPEPNEVAQAVLSKSTWAVLGLTLDIELFTQAHYRSSIEPDAELSPLWKDVFLFHWREESQHAILDELEWRREHARLTEAQRDQGVDDLIGLVAAVDGIVQAQAQADAEYFIGAAGRSFTPTQGDAIHDGLLRAYRWQYVASGVQEPRFAEVLGELTTPVQRERIGRALAPIVGHAAD